MYSSRMSLIALLLLGGLARGASAASGEWTRFRQDNYFDYEYKFNPKGTEIAWQVRNHLDVSIYIGTIKVRYACRPGDGIATHYLSKTVRTGRTARTAGYDVPCKTGRPVPGEIVEVDAYNPKRRFDITYKNYCKDDDKDNDNERFVVEEQVGGAIRIIYQDKRGTATISPALADKIRSERALSPQEAERVRKMFCKPPDTPDGMWEKGRAKFEKTFPGYFKKELIEARRDRLKECLKNKPKEKCLAEFRIPRAGGTREPAGGIRTRPRKGGAAPDPASGENAKFKHYRWWKGILD